MELENPNNGDFIGDDLDSACSTPYTSAPSSPGRGASRGYFFSAPASPMHYILTSTPFSVAAAASSDAPLSGSSSYDFDFSAPCPAASAAAGSMSTADELFLNGQIRPMKLSPRGHRPRPLTPLLDVDTEDEDNEESEVEMVRGRDLRTRSRSMHRRTRSMSPMRHSVWREDGDERKDEDLEVELDLKQAEDTAAAPDSTSTSRSSSSGRNSKRWVFLKEFLYRSKSEGRGTTVAKEKEKFWHSLSFSPSSSKDKSKKAAPAAAAPKKPPVSGTGKRRGPAPSAHERHYTANRAVSEEMRKRTFLPYRQGLLGCLGFGSRSYGAVNGFARALNPVYTSLEYDWTTGAMLPYAEYVLVAEYPNWPTSANKFVSTDRAL